MKVLVNTALVLLLSACAAIGVQAPQNVSEAINEAAGTVKTVAHDVHDAKVSGLIDQRQADDLKAQLNEAIADIDQARVLLAAAQPNQAQDKVQQAHFVLGLVISALEARKHGTH